MQILIQIWFLLRTLVILKSWRLLTILPVMALLFFGTQVSFFAAKYFVEWRMERNISHVSAANFKNFAGHISTDTKIMLPAVLKIFDYLKLNDPPGMFGTYLSTINCISRMETPFVLNVAATSRYHIDFKQSASICQASYSSMLCCALFAALASIGNSGANGTSNDTYLNLHVFQHVSPVVWTASCSAEPDYFMMLPKILPIELSLISAIVSVYLLIATVSVISELKVKGFLQVMMRKGLSPFAYWAAVWITTGVEMLLLSACLSASFHWQCPKLYTTGRIIHASLIIVAYLLCQAALILLFTVLSNNYYTICKFVLLYVVIYIGITLSDRFARDIQATYADLDALKMIVPLLPCVGVANQLHEVFGSQGNPSVRYGTLTGFGNLALLILLVAVTLYLDHVLKSGNGLEYDKLLFVNVPVNEPLPADTDRPPCVQPSKLNVFARVSAALTSNVSVDFYDNQITVVFCEDSTRSSLLLSMLTGRFPVDSGLVWINGYPASKRGGTPHQHTRIGECPQEDALCYNLTVMHTLNLALVSSGNAWVDCEAEVSKALALLRLVDKLQCSVSSLSSGERRKLSVAIALLGKPRMIVLSDPTRGLDPLSRHRFWRLLMDYRNGRCIIVSTQFIDETDVYTDRDVLLSPTADLILCAGSTEFVRHAAISGVFVKAVLSERARNASTIEKYWGNMPPGVSASVRKTLLMVSLASSEAQLLQSVVKALKEMGPDVGTVALYLPLISDVYKRLKSFSVIDINKLFAGSRMQQNQSANADAEKTNEQKVITGDASNTEQVLMEVAQQRSKPSFADSTWGILNLHSSVLQRSYHELIRRAALLLVLFVLHAYMLTFERRSIDTSLNIWENVSAQSVGKFSRGFCVSDSDIPALHRSTDEQCNRFYTGTNRTTKNFRVIWKTKADPFYNFLMLPNQTNAMRNHCSTLKPSELPCAIVYSNSWYRFMYNQARQVAAGSFSFKHKQEKTALAAYFAMLTVLDYFSNGKPINKMGVSMLLDFNHFTIPTYGVLSLGFFSTIMPSIFLHDVIRRKSSNLRCYLATMGIDPMAFWASFLLLHWPQCAVAYFVAFFLGLVISFRVFKTIYVLLSALVTIIFGLSNNLLTAYLLSLLIPGSRRILPAVHFLLSVVIGISPAVLLTKSTICSIMIIAVPPFATAVLTLYSVKLYIYATSVANLNSFSSIVKTLVSQPQIRTCLIAIPVQTVVLIAALVIVDKVHVYYRGCLEVCSSADGAAKSDDQLLESKEKGEAILPEDTGTTVELKGMTKSFSNTDAVRNVTLQAQKGETLGIIGPNGSGITTISTAIVGQIVPSSGTCQVRARGSSWLSGRPIGSLGLIAYAPQSNQLLFKSLTASEHLQHFARILGASGDRVDQLVQSMNLSGAQGKPAAQLSEDLKRWLSISIPLLSCSPLLIIDDAATGVNPTGEMQHLWKQLGKVSSEYATTIISANSLVGADALNCRVVLLSSGVVAFEGTVDSLMHRHGFHILDVEIKAATKDAARGIKSTLLKAIMGRFVSARILNQTSKRMQVAIPTQRFGSQVDSLIWLVQMKEENSIPVLQFYSATPDQTLEHLLKSHDGVIAAKCEQSPMATFYEHCEP